MAKTAVYTVMGGLGRQLMQAQIALELTEKYDRVLVFAHYVNELSVFFKIASEHFYVRIDRSVVAVKIVTPYVRKKLFSRKRDAFIVNHVE